MTVLHSFGGAGDGQNPGGAMFQSGSTLYAMTAGGGSAADGTVFRIETDGNAYFVMHSFAGYPGDGQNPNGSFIQFGPVLYGVTPGGGASGAGTVVKIGIDGTGYGLQHQFGGGPGDGSQPYGSLVQSGSILYGITRSGGSANLGTIFKVNADNTGYTLLHSFAGGSADGQQPLYATLVASGSTLFGMTFGGGAAGFGTIFKIGTDGSGFALLHSFAGGPGDGEIPYGSLTLSGSALYGTTAFGGAANKGTIFQIGTDGTGFNVMHSFAGGPSDGANPEGDLLLSGATLNGMTPNGGIDALGTLFGIQTDGSGFNVLHSFAGGPGDGANPQGDLILSGSAFYGMTVSGGSSNDGVIFSYAVAVPEPSSLMLLSTVGGTAVVVCRWRFRAWFAFRFQQP
jgi:uncharacterized repeat protein (TIGR03803 family)